MTRLFGELLELPPDQRAMRLHALSSEDPGLHRELHSLLDSYDTAGDRFETAAGPLGASQRMIGTRLGPFRITRLIAEGGMGAVYEGERQDGEFAQRVAIKLLLAAFDGTVGRSRFAHERRLLAGLSHRNIATLIDGGVADDGRPWLAMEYVDGAQITHWCREHGLDTRDRLALFRQVTAAVQHAHSHLVVHRDLKPGNILVASDGTVKLLDFGIAKLLDPTGTDTTDNTRTGHAPFTAAYASPEQLRHETVTTASDIYALGVILYELVTGRRPFAEGQQRDELPEAPSRLVDASIPRSMARDLDAIVLTAMRPEPERRYDTAQQLGDDVQRLLTARPVSARADTLRYRLASFVRRNRIATAAGVVAVLALVTGAAVATRQAQIATLERDRARQEAARTRRVTEFFRDVLSTARPLAEGRDVTVLEAIDAVVPSLDTAFTGQPDLRAAIQNTLGATFTDMGLPVRARDLLLDAADTLRRYAAGRDNRELADALYNLAGAEVGLGDARRGEQLYRESLGMYLRLTPGDSTDYYGGLNNLALAIHDQGRLAEAIDLYLLVARWHMRGDSGSTRAAVPGLINAATALTELGRYDTAEVVFHAAARAVESTEGDASPRLAALLQPLAGAQMFEGKYQEAETSARRAWAIWNASLGGDNPVTLTAMRMLVNIFAEADRCSEAVAMADSILAYRGGTLLDSDPTLGTALLFAGWCRVGTEEAARGQSQVREGLALRRAVFPATHWAVAHAEVLAGAALVAAGPATRDEGVALLRSGERGLSRELAPDNVRVLQARRMLQEATQ